MNLRAGANPEVSTDPSNPPSGSSWVLANGKIGSPGLAMGPMGLTYTQPVVNTYTMKFKTEEGKVAKVDLI